MEYYYNELEHHEGWQILIQHTMGISFLNSNKRLKRGFLSETVWSWPYDGDKGIFRIVEGEMVASSFSNAYIENKK
jgi:hypothetical protein